MRITKVNSAKNWGGIPYGKMGTSITHSIQVSHLKSCISITAQTILKSEKVQTVFTFEQKHGTWRKQTDLLLGWEDESVLSSKANPACILSETGCAQICCVFWLPLFITSNTSSAYSQYSGSSTMHLNSMTATGDLSPGATASDLLSSCILSHLGAHH